MAIQIGTVDGLINVSTEKILLLIKAIDAFTKGGIEEAKKQNLSLGNAFQRFCEPVYKGIEQNFSLKSLAVPVYTKGGKEQSPSKVTYCKKMGLLDIDIENGIFKLTDIAKAILNSKVSVEEYCLLLLSKQGCFVDDKYSLSLFSLLGEWFKNNCSISEIELKNFCCNVFYQTDIIKTRFDIILNALVFCGILKDVSVGKYVLADLYAGIILNTFNKVNTTPSPIDTAPEYISYMGTFSYGIFDAITPEIVEIIRVKYPNLLNEKAITVGNHIIAPIYGVSSYSSYLTAMRTKPFLLLAGISGTGKSRIVKEMAFASCPPELRQDKVTPGNYCMIEVKPNWHDSTELIGYESKINGDHYVVTPFINFLIKALHYPNVPFFVCLDEMNLAPVEQYFAEYLSVLESRKFVEGKIVSDALIKPEIFSKKSNFDSFKNAYFRDTLTPGGLVPEEYAPLWKELGDHGLRLPANVIVVGTVNMDETTYQFSRKVIDRAMTIEMNEVDFKSMFAKTEDTLAYRDSVVGAEYFVPKYTSAKEVLSVLSKDDKEYLEVHIPRRLEALDAALANTPFRIAYRVENELILYFAALREERHEATAAELLAAAIDDILMMKVLPRVEGDEALLGDDNERRGPLTLLAEFTAESCPKAHKKVQEMHEKLRANHFTSFWP